MNILFIGNSYTYYNDMPALFQALARENGKDVTVYAVTKGGRKLIAYTDPADPVTQALDAQLAERRYEVCVLQEQSLLPIRDGEQFLTGLTHVAEKVKGCTDRLVLYATWGRKEGSPKLAELGLTTEGMARELETAYLRAAERLGAALSPVGRRFLQVYQSHPDIELYDPDLSHPSYQGSCLAALTHYCTLFGQPPAHARCLALSDAAWAVFRAVVCQ